MIIKKKMPTKRNQFFCWHVTDIIPIQWNVVSDSDRIQTCNLLIRSQMLYSVELRSHTPNQ